MGELFQLLIRRDLDPTWPMVAVTLPWFASSPARFFYSLEDWFVCELDGSGKVSISHHLFSGKSNLTSWFVLFFLMC